MYICQKLPSDIKLIPEFIDKLIPEIKQLPLDTGQVHDIRLSLEEALINAIKHGNKFDPELVVEVSVGSDDASLTITVTDQGKGFDFKNIPDPTKPDNFQKLSGRGVLLIKHHMDSVEFLNGGSQIKMSKFFKEGVRK